MRRIPVGKILIALGMVGVIALVVFLLLPKPVAVDVVRVERGDLLVTIDEDGETRIKRKHRFVVTAPFEGHLRKIHLDEGNRVYGGNWIAEMEPRIPSALDARALEEANLRVKVAEENKKKAEAQYADAKHSYKLAYDRYIRAEQLLVDSSISRDEYDARQHEMRIKKAKMDAAKFAQGVAVYERDLAVAGQLHIKPGHKGRRKFRIPGPPFETIVLKVLEENARVVQAGAEIIELGELDDINKLEVVVDVLSEDAVMIPPRAKVFLERWGIDRPTLVGYVDKVEPKGYLKISALGVEEQRVDVIIHFNEKVNRKRDPKNFRKSLGDAYRVQARIVIWEGENVVKVPAGALFRKDGAWAVFVIDDDRAHLRKVQVGQSNGLETEIKSGLEEGDAVILHPSDQIRDGIGVYAR